MFDYANYRKQVLQTYKEKRDANTLSPRLIHPSPRKLRDECLAVVRERFHPKDQQVLRIFFDSCKNEKDCIQAIERLSIDKFRPVINFIKESVSDTDEKNVEILAWLIDFEPRPFNHKKAYGDALSIQQEEIIQSQKGNDSAAVNNTPEEENEVNEVEEGTVDETTMPGQPTKSDPRRRFFFFMDGAKKKVFFFAGGPILICVLVAVYWFFSNENSVMSISLKGECMYWTGDHYEPVPCTTKIENASVIALDTIKVKYFKRITHCDTITVKAMGSVWYSKINNKVEFYTAPGNHPVQTEYHLKPATKYIIAKYCQ